MFLLSSGQVAIKVAVTGPALEPRTLLTLDLCFDTTNFRGLSDVLSKYVQDERRLELIPPSSGIDINFLRFQYFNLS